MISSCYYSPVVCLTVFVRTIASVHIFVLVEHNIIFVFSTLLRLVVMFIVSSFAYCDYLCLVMVVNLIVTIVSCVIFVLCPHCTSYIYFLLCFLSYCYCHICVYYGNYVRILCHLLSGFLRFLYSIVWHISPSSLFFS